MTFLQRFGFDKTVGHSGKNGDIFSLNGQLFQHRRRSFIW
jgi:hypothetical protein